MIKKFQNDRGLTDEAMLKLLIDLELIEAPKVLKVQRINSDLLTSLRAKGTVVIIKGDK